MDQQKMLDLTMQVQHNQSELKDFLTEMDSWELDIKKKEEKMTKSDNKDKTPDIPPVRNSAFKKKTKKKVKEKSHDTKTKRISGRDFRAWDKYDVDKALEDIDGSKTSSSSEYETDEEWEIQRKQQQAIMMKDEGNQYFKDGQFAEAISCYTKGIQCDSTNAMLYANRAMALLKQEKYAAAEVDCTDAIAIDPTYVKAYSRRATARQKLEMFEEARSDFLKVLSFEPANKLARNEVEKIEKILNPPEPDPEGLVYPVTKTPEERSKKPLKRMEIEEIGDDEANKVQALKTVGQSEVTKKIVEQDNKLFDYFLKSAGDSHPSKDNESKIFNSDSKEPTTVSNGIPPIETSESSPTKEISSPRQSTSPRTGIPQNSYQFQADWKVLKNDLQNFAQYLQKIPPQLYPKLIGESLEADVLVSILKTLKEFSSGFSDVFAHLKHLANVKRFSMTVMFLSGTDKQIIRDLFSSVESSGNVSKDEFTKLKITYKL